MKLSRIILPVVLLLASASPAFAAGTTIYYIDSTHIKTLKSDTPGCATSGDTIFDYPTNSDFPNVYHVSNSSTYCLDSVDENIGTYTQASSKFTKYNDWTDGSPIQFYPITWVNGDPETPPTPTPFAKVDTTVNSSTSAVLSGLSSTGITGLTMAILGGGVLLISTALLFWILRKFRRLVGMQMGKSQSGWSGSTNSSPQKWAPSNDFINKNK